MNLLDALRARRLLAIIRGTDPEAAVRAALTLAEEGISLLEVSLTTPDAFGVLSRVRAELDADTDLGAGTVVTAEDATRAADAGAGFLVTPAITPGLTVAAERGLPLLCGALSPSEVVTAVQHGAVAVKLFPASLGGPRYLRALRDPFPTVPFVPVGGVDADAAREYLAAGAVAVGVGSPLLGDAASGGSLSDLRDRARRFRAIADEGVRPENAR
ncbi:MAG TPA: bifunctional 4-hydroxy-2-oxoglutarate aldolase/2-dehydro-3-deoxy-phosphogluconate aldolase [Trebonia sp.]|jgi:2-dehydro-3-deoxyphosphogluconate aldolase/(4S)-4-hydroxy-2-oxoglutarate aldolase|nr:bifunctional 4-hydroxy-2-oxoglutarate aldolase/2-dehydro-3-deoxy-phosphogluconate aldolase [Trebonia sp.]